MEAVRNFVVENVFNLDSCNIQLIDYSTIYCKIYKFSFQFEDNI
jgi:hypothetical protein